MEQKEVAEFKINPESKWFKIILLLVLLTLDYTFYIKLKTESQLFEISQKGIISEAKIIDTNGCERGLFRHKGWRHIIVNHNGIRKDMRMEYRFCKELNLGDEVQVKSLPKYEKEIVYTKLNFRTEYLLSIFFFVILLIITFIYSLKSYKTLLP